MNIKFIINVTYILCVLCLYSFCRAATVSASSDLDMIIKKGELRHLGMPYANFIKGNAEGLETEIVKGFAEYLGVKYKFIKVNWEDYIPSLTGIKYELRGNKLVETGKGEIKGDILATGLTKLDWREKVMDFSKPTFPTQVWCIARYDSPLVPIKASGNIEKDIANVKKLIKDKEIMYKKGTSLEPRLYGINNSIKTINFTGNLNDMAPAIIKGESEVSLLDVPDALVALKKWPGKIKVLGPLSKKQYMAAAFRKGSVQLRNEFNNYLDKLFKSGEYDLLIQKYYPAIYTYFSPFFHAIKQTN